MRSLAFQRASEYVQSRDGGFHLFYFYNKTFQRFAKQSALLTTTTMQFPGLVTIYHAPNAMSPTSLRLLQYVSPLKSPADFHAINSGRVWNSRVPALHPSGVPQLTHTSYNLDADIHFCKQEVTHNCTGACHDNIEPNKCLGNSLLCQETCT